MKTIGIVATVVCAVLVAINHPATAAPGDPDPTFGGTGKVTTSIGDGHDFGAGVVVQSDQKIVVAGDSSIAGIHAFALIRYNPDGSLDASFNGTGFVRTSIGNTYDSAQSVALQNDGKIVIAGSSQSDEFDFAAVRYNANGSLDTSFNGTGFVTTRIGTAYARATSVALQNDGKVLLTGNSYYNGANAITVVRYNTNGSLDTSFNGTGIVVTTILNNSIGSGIAVQTDGKIVVAGTTSSQSDASFALVRYNPNGSLDTTFNGTGIVTTEFGDPYNAGSSVAVQDDERIVIGGASSVNGNTEFALARYNTDGSLDASFNGTGKVITSLGTGSDEIRAVSVQSDGKILAAGFSYNGVDNDFALVRYNPDGSLDTTFNGTGTVTTAISNSEDIGLGMAVQSDGAIVVTGLSGPEDGTSFAVVRYLGDPGPDADGDGIPDQYETGSGIYVSPTNTGSSPTNPDSDGDGLNDYAEVYNYICNPNVPDTDGDGLTDGYEVSIGSSPRNSDSDGDGLNDHAEVITYNSNPNVRDTDGDGFDDGYEVSIGSSPTSAASTPEGLTSIRVAAEYRFNAANGVSYRIEASTDLANWQTIETDIIGTGGVITRFYSTEGQPKRFFRSRRN